METPQKPEGQQPHRPSKSPFEKLKSMLDKFIKFFNSMQEKGREIQVHPPEGEAPQNAFKAIAFTLWHKLDDLLGKGLAKLPESARKMAEPHRSKILIALIALVTLFTVKTLFFHGPKKPKISLEDAMKQKEQKSTDSVIPIKGFRVGRFNFEDSLNALGTIKGAMEFKLSFEVPGTISSINYREGERYEEGALLVSLKQDDILLRLKRAQAEFNKANSQASIQEQKVKENEKLFAMGAIPKSTLDNVKLEWESSKYEAEANRLEVKANEAMLEKSNLYAPSAGMIGDLNVEEGETITQNTLLGTHIMTEYVYAEFGVVERDVNKIALGQKARVFVDAYPDKTFEGVIENVAPVVAGTSRTATVKVRVENPDRLLLPGMFARIRILLYSKKNTLVVPTDSVQGKEGEQFVYVVHSGKGPLIQQSKNADKGAKDNAPEGAKAPAQAGGQEGQPQEIKPDQPAALPGAPGANVQGAPKAPQLPLLGGARDASGKPVPDTKKKGKKQAEVKGQTDAKPEKKPEEDLSVKKRPITVGYTRPDYTQIDAGLSEGEVVAISGLEKLEDDKKVRLLETQEAEI